VSTLLEKAGFKLAPGQLEVFPNCKAYVTSGEHSRYNGHRLPMQAGSYLLNADLQMLWGNQATFVQHWQFAQQRNSLDTKALDRILKAARRRQFRVTGKADKFLNDLNAEIEQGWTGPGQTNRLLGRIAMRSYTKSCNKRYRCALTLIPLLWERDFNLALFSLREKSWG